MGQVKTALHVIAEAGTNHNGRRDLGRRLVGAAAEAGADSVKFQLIYPEGLYLPELYEAGRTRPNEVFAKRRAAMLPDEDWKGLAGDARERGIPLSASVFDERGLALLDALDPPYIKIASCDLNNSRLLAAAAGLGRRLVVSTGMATLAEVARAVEDVARTGHKDLVLMHCVSVYPCPVERTNISFVRTLSREFGLPVGWSDHTESATAAAMAVALGATWVEKHLTLDRAMEGFDHAYAMEPAPFRDYVAELRRCAASCAQDGDKLSEAEREVRRRARRGLYAARPLEAGRPLRREDILVVRPEGPLSPNDAESLVGRAPRRAIARYEPLAPGDLEGP